MPDVTVLVVDDDDAIRATLVDVLAEEGYRTRQATNGARALEAIRAMTRDGESCVVLLDMMMPEVTGAQVLAALRDEGLLAIVPVVVVTAMRPTFAETAGARMCLHKPIDLTTLLRLVERLAPEAAQMASGTRRASPASGAGSRKAAG